METQYNNYPQNSLNGQNQVNGQKELGYQTGNNFQSTVQNFGTEQQDYSQNQARELGYIDQSFGQNSSQSPSFSRANNPGQSGNIEAFNSRANSNNPQNLAYNLGMLGINNP